MGSHDDIITPDHIVVGFSQCGGGNINVDAVSVSSLFVVVPGCFGCSTSDKPVLPQSTVLCTTAVARQALGVQRRGRQLRPPQGFAHEEGRRRGGGA